MIVVLVSLLAVLDLANYGIPPTHDGEYHIMRFQQFVKVISEGTLYPRWAPDFNNGFGIPLFNYVYPLPNYFASLTHILGFSFIDSLKLNMAAATLVGSIFIYLWARRYWGDLGGVVSSVFYTFSPYHFLDVYVRGSVGEVWSLGLVPGLLWVCLNYHETKSKKFLVLSSVFLALLILAHNILAVVFFGFFLVYALFLIRINLRDLVIIVVSGLGLAAPFWLPALLETKYVVGLQVFDPTRNFPVLYKLIYSSWGYGFSGDNSPDQMSFQIGIANLIAVVGSIFFALKAKKNKQLLFFFIGLFLITVFFITSFSAFLWKSLPFVSFVQFPWRLLSLVILIVSFLTGSLVGKRKIVAILLIILSIGFSIRYAKAPFYHKRADMHYLTRSNFTDGTNSPGDLFNTKWLAGVPKKENNKIKAIDGSVEIKVGEFKSESYQFETIATKSSKIIINTAYFPGWTAKINGKKVRLENYNGRMLLYVPNGVNGIRIFLDSTGVQKFSYVYFLVSVLVLVLFSIRSPVIIKK